MGDCQIYGPFLGPHYNTGPNTGPNLGDPKRDHNFDIHPYDEAGALETCAGCCTQTKHKESVKLQCSKDANEDLTPVCLEQISARPAAPGARAAAADMNAVAPGRPCSDKGHGVSLGTASVELKRALALRRLRSGSSSSGSHNPRGLGLRVQGLGYHIQKHNHNQITKPKLQPQTLNPKI